MSNRHHVCSDSSDSMYADMHLQQQQQQQLWDSSSNSWRGEAAGMWLHNGVWYSQGPSQQNSVGTGTTDDVVTLTIVALAIVALTIIN
jgi:hypothetical protein